MNVAQIRKYDVANGPGIRTTVFVSGCTHNCKNCFNLEYQDFEYGTRFTIEKQEEVIEYIRETRRLSILGGEPMQQQWELVRFLNSVKEETNAEIWMWTGYTFENLIDEKNEHLYQREMLKHIDVIVDGPFIESKKDLTLRFKGSSNQRVIDVKKSLKEKQIILKEGYEK